MDEFNNIRRDYHIIIGSAPFQVLAPPLGFDDADNVFLRRVYLYDREPGRPVVRTLGALRRLCDAGRAALVPNSGLEIPSIDTQTNPDSMSVGTVPDGRREPCRGRRTTATSTRNPVSASTKSDGSRSISYANSPNDRRGTWNRRPQRRWTRRTQRVPANAAGPATES